MIGFGSDSRSPYLPPEAELSESFILSGGPGGQHVNRTESAVQLRFDTANSRFLSEPIRVRLCKLAGHRCDRDGVILIEARSHRSQLRNREEARARLADLIEAAHHQPRARIATKPSRSAKRKRLEGKRARAGIKRARGKPDLQS